MTPDEFNEKWAGRAATIRGNRDFLHNHNFKIEAEVQNMILREIEMMLLDFDIVIETEQERTE